jgi:16S rRNA (cytosine1402-N4)-methyltransferase
VSTDDKSQKQPHTTVLLEESIAALQLQPGDIAMDCTVGGGGHTELLLAAVGPTGRVFGLDRDESALRIATARLGSALATGCLKLVHAPFSDVASVAREQGVHGQVAGILADIGVSSMHIDEGERGFSFQKDGPLDMRMDRSRGRTAADLIADAEESELARIFFEYGEEPQSRQIARRIVERRGQEPITTTLALAELVKRSVRYKTKSEKHPATRVFQALRLAVNDELGELRSLLDGGFETLRPGGRFGIISFHSLEDRLVKNAFVDLTGRRERAKVPRDLPLSAAQIDAISKPRGEIVKPFPLAPSDTETRRNPRARSAKLRVIEKIRQ